MNLRRPSLLVLFVFYLTLFAESACPSAAHATGDGAARDVFLLTELVSAKRVTVQRISGPPADSCRAELIAPSDTIACYPAASVNRAPKGKWVQQVLKLSAPWAWVRGRAGLDPMFMPSFGLHFRGDSLNVDWILSLEPLSAMIRIDGVISASATVPDEDHVQLLELMRRPFPKDHELVARHIIEEERHEPKAGTVAETAGFEEARAGHDFAPVGEISYEGCDCRPGIEGEPPCYDHAPEPVTAPPPTYPVFAREAQIQGKVLLHVLVGSDGRVANIKVFRGVTGLNDVTIDAVGRWVFKPALKDGEPVCAWIEIPVDFHF